ncbi:hypothetical protein BD626DRAFT_563586 [Schizophyllum amplum]|uniref:Uncharacterized protein n=1 Tax=Schizophyllum amplum TaxID=97359 RepID=A0A550CYK7_9AGAR|nr:hypothetical protein BD626DRAFT_563586 [Auriculariopsis ampla]
MLARTPSPPTLPAPTATHTSAGEIVPFPYVPTEILRDIVDFAAASSPRSAANLTLTASHVRAWVLPMMYHSVVLSTSPSVSKFLAALTSAHLAPSSRLHLRRPLQDLVRNLAILALGPIDSIACIIERCRYVQNRACGFSLSGYKQRTAPLGSDADADAAARSRLAACEQHFLGLACRDGFHPALIAPSTTHLQLQLVPQSAHLLTGLSTHVPALTHLAVSLSASTPPSTLPQLLPELARVLREHETLQVLMVQVAGFGHVKLTDALEEWQAGPAQDDRVVVCAAPISLVRQWGETSAFKIGGLWRRAEGVVRERQEKRRREADEREKRVRPTVRFTAIARPELGRRKASSSRVRRLRSRSRSRTGERVSAQVQVLPL